MALEPESSDLIYTQDREESSGDDRRNWPFLYKQTNPSYSNLFRVPFVALHSSAYFLDTLSQQSDHAFSNTALS